MGFLRHLRGHLHGGKLLVIWDGSPIHRHKAMRAFRLSAEAEEHFVFEALPAYAPDLDPLDTGIWHHLKDVALANVCCRAGYRGHCGRSCLWSGGAERLAQSGYDQVAVQVISQAPAEDAA